MVSNPRYARRYSSRVDSSIRVSYQNNVMLGAERDRGWGFTVDTVLQLFLFCTYSVKRVFIDLFFSFFFLSSLFLFVIFFFCFAASHPKAEQVLAVSARQRAEVSDRSCWTQRVRRVFSAVDTLPWRRPIQMHPCTHPQVIALTVWNKRSCKINTVKAVQSDHPLVQTKAVFVDRWPRFAGFIRWSNAKLSTKEVTGKKKKMITKS